MRVRNPMRLAVLVTLMLAACGGGANLNTPGPMPPDNSEVATSLTIDQFLRAANSNDIDTMARLFGTRNGSILIRDRREDVERQMFALASLLRHDSYEIVRRDIVPGRRDEATKLFVRMTIGERRPELPFTLVFSVDRVWRVEQIGLEMLNR